MRRVSTHMWKRRRTRLSVTPLRSAKRELERVGAARVRVRVRFAPKGGKQRTRTRTIRLVKRDGG